MAHTILVIEDQEDIAYLAQLILQGAGYIVLLAGSGEAGLRLLDEQPIDLLLLDLMLPGVDGWEVCRRIRATRTRSEFPIILFSVHSMTLDNSHPDYALANSMISKPFERMDLLTTVQACLAPSGECDDSR